MYVSLCYHTRFQCMINSLDKNDSLREWERLEKSKARMFSKFDACLSEMNSDDADTRKHGLESLKRELSSMTSEDRVIFTITHSLRNCDIQEKLYEMMKKKKSPRVTGATSPELLQIMDLIQGLSLLHYESKQLASRSQRMAVILTYLATKDLKLVVYTLEALEAILVDSCTNLRAFEFNGGLKLLCNILKQNKANENLV